MIYIFYGNIYLVLFLVITFFTLSDLQEGFKRNSIVFFYFCVSMAFFVSAFREGVVYDFDTYLRFVEAAKQNINDISDFFRFYTEVAKVEPMSLLIVWAANFAFTIYSVFFFFSFLSFLALSYSFKRLSPYPIVSLFLFFSHEYLYLFNGQIRAGLALVLVYVSICYFIVSRYFWSWFFLIISVLFHYSALIVVPFLIFHHFAKEKNAIKFLMAVLFLSLALGASGIAHQFVSYTFHLLGSPDFLKRYVLFALDHNRNSIDITMIKNSVILAISLFYLKCSSLRKNRQFRFLVSILIAGLSVRVFFWDFSELAGRFSSIFNFSILFFLHRHQLKTA